MATIRESARQYEDWLRKQLHGDVLEQDLAKKRDKMRESAFVFLRATYWRWAETIFDVCPDLAGGTQEDEDQKGKPAVIREPDEDE